MNDEVTITLTAYEAQTLRQAMDIAFPRTKKETTVFWKVQRADVELKGIK